MSAQFWFQYLANPQRTLSCSSGSANLLWLLCFHFELNSYISIPQNKSNLSFRDSPSLCSDGRVDWGTFHKSKQQTKSSWSRSSPVSSEQLLGVKDTYIHVSEVVVCVWVVLFECHKAWLLLSCFLVRKLHHIAFKCSFLQVGFVSLHVSLHLQ